MGSDRGLETRRRRVGPSEMVPLALGAVGLAAGTLLGWDAGLIDALVGPPAIVRAGLAAIAAVVAVVCLREALARISRAGAGPVSTSDLPTMVRGVRFIFLAVAAAAAALGWLLGHPLPVVVALVIAGIDILETSFLLLVVRVRG